MKYLKKNNKAVFKMANKISSFKDLHNINNIKSIKYDSSRDIYGNISDLFLTRPIASESCRNPGGGK